MMAGQHAAADSAAAEAATAKIADADRKLARYRAAIDADGDSITFARKRLED